MTWYGWRANLFQRVSGPGLGYTASSGRTSLGRLCYAPPPQVGQTMVFGTKLKEGLKHGERPSFPEVLGVNEAISSLEDVFYVCF